MRSSVKCNYNILGQWTCFTINSTIVFHNSHEEKIWIGALSSLRAGIATADNGS